MTRTKIIALAGAGATAMMLNAHSTLAQDAYQIPQITVYTDQAGKTDADSSGTTKTGSTTLTRSQIEQKRATTSDTAALLQDVLGVNVYSAGGVSSLPTMHGLADDRLRTKVDGMDIVASCPNHMNPALSYIDPSSVSEVKVWTGVAPVSVSGDAIGGTIAVKSARPKFAGEATAKDGKGEGATLVTGNVGAFYRSNGNGFGGNLNTTLATDSLSLTYNGAYAKSDDYKAGGHYKNFTLAYVPPLNTPLLPGKTVGSSAYEATNHSVDLAWTDSDSLLDLKLGLQKIPYEWYPNQRMDMLDNTSLMGNLRWEEKFRWGKLEAQAYHQYVDHFMDFGDDRNKWYGWLATPSGPMNVMGMPMYTKTHTTGASLKSDIEVSASDTLRLGAEAQFYRLDDWWPPSPDCGYTAGVANCRGGMAPDTFWNINNGERDRLAAFGEWESQWNDKWQSLLGVRLERVATDTGPVQGYSTFYTTSSVGSTADFNNMDRSRVDYNLDLSSIVTYKPQDNLKLDLGLAQKNRSPNLYERYDWSRGLMALEMNNFVGDGNGYMGDPNLKKETSRTISFTADWRSDDDETGFTVSPYFTHVSNYIDAAQWNMTTNLPADPTVTGTGSVPTTGPNQFVMLKYVNQTANIGGIDVAVRMPLAKSSLGDFALRGSLNYARGVNTVTHDGLYNIMPLNGKVTLAHRLNGWDNALEFVMVDGKDHVSSMRNELHTPAYSLLNLRSSYTLNNWKLNFGVENILDKKYTLPLGGAYVGEGNSMSFQGEVGNVGLMTPGGASTGSRGTASMYGTGVPGPGRSFYLSTSYSF